MIGIPIHVKAFLGLMNTVSVLRDPSWFHSFQACTQEELGSICGAVICDQVRASTLRTSQIKTRFPALSLLQAEKQWMKLSS